MDLTRCYKTAVFLPQSTGRDTDIPIFKTNGHNVEL